MGPAWGDRYPYLEYMRRVDVRSLIEENLIVDTGARRGKADPGNCLLCDEAVATTDALRLNHGSWVCGACLLQLQHTRYPEQYQKVYEEYVVASEAWRQAHADLEQQLEATFPTSALQSRVESLQIWFGILIGAGVLVGFALPAVGLPVAALAGIILAVSVPSLNREITRLNGEVLRARQSWDAKNRRPPEPELKDFHDPKAKLTERDERIQQIFDYWPGYPPYWHYVRRVVLARDERCQITGCPSRTEIHVHHRVPLARGGSHKPENLVALCAFHHGLQPDMGHELVWREISTRYFGLVCAHMRAGVPVRAHVRRRSVVAQNELLGILRFHAVCCPDCGSESLQLTVDYQLNKVHVVCKGCSIAKTFPQKLTEETGPQMCEALKPTRNVLSAEVDWELMQGERQPVGARKTHAARRTKAAARAPRCPTCGSPLRMRDGRYGKFWGCSAFPRCRYTRDHEGNPRSRRRVSPN